MKSSRKSPSPCNRFEPQTWRKSLCKNCFKTEEEHLAVGVAVEEEGNISKSPIPPKDATVETPSPPGPLITEDEKDIIEKKTGAIDGSSSYAESEVVLPVKGATIIEPHQNKDKLNINSSGSKKVVSELTVIADSTSGELKQQNVTDISDVNRTTSSDSATSAAQLSSLSTISSPDSSIKPRGSDKGGIHHTSQPTTLTVQRKDAPTDGASRSIPPPHPDTGKQSGFNGTNSYIEIPAPHANVSAQHSAISTEAKPSAHDATESQSSIGSAVTFADSAKTDSSLVARPATPTGQPKSSLVVQLSPTSPRAPFGINPTPVSTAAVPASTQASNPTGSNVSSSSSRPPQHVAEPSGASRGQSEVSLRVSGGANSGTSGGGEEIELQNARPTTLHIPQQQNLGQSGKQTSEAKAVSSVQIDNLVLSPAVSPTPSDQQKASALHIQSPPTTPGHRVQTSITLTPSPAGEKTLVNRDHTDSAHSPHRQVEPAKQPSSVVRESASSRRIPPSHRGVSQRSRTRHTRIRLGDSSSDSSGSSVASSPAKEQLTQPSTSTPHSYITSSSLFHHPSTASSIPAAGQPQLYAQPQSTAHSPTQTTQLSQASYTQHTSSQNHLPATQQPHQLIKQQQHQQPQQLQQPQLKQFNQQPQQQQQPQKQTNQPQSQYNQSVQQQNQINQNQRNYNQYIQNQQLIGLSSNPSDDDLIRQSRQRDLAKQNRRRRRQASFDERDIRTHRDKISEITMSMGRDEALMEGTRLLIDTLRDKLSMSEGRCQQLEREKLALHDLLTVKKEECNQIGEDSQLQIAELEDEVRRLLIEKSRLVDKLKLPESERSSLALQENELAKLHKKLDEHEAKLEHSREENLCLRHEIADLHLEMDEMHDQFREDEAIEFRELQKELEATAKNCRILQFKLRKSERRTEQMEHEAMQYEEKIRMMESRLMATAGGDRQHIADLEEELRMAKEVSVRLHDELELVEEKRGRYEEELDRVNDILTESENRRQILQRELDSVHTKMEEMRTQQRSGPVESRLDVPSKAKQSTVVRQGSKEMEIEQVMRDLSDSLERENDLKDQMKYAQEETRSMRTKLADLEEENESLTFQLQKLSSAKSSKYFGGKKDGDSESELKLALEMAEQEVKVLKRKLDVRDTAYEKLQEEIRTLQASLGEVEDSKIKPSDDARTYDERIESMARDIDKLKWKLIEKDRAGKVSKKLQRSKSLEDEAEATLSKELKKQLENAHQEYKTLREKLSYIEDENDKLVTENKKLQLLSSRRLPSITTDDSAMQNIELKDKIKQIESENATLRSKIASLDKKTTKISKDVIVSKAAGDVVDETSANREKELRSLRDENRNLKRKISDLEARNATLNIELKKLRKDNSDKPSEDFKQTLVKAGRDDLLDKIWDLEGEIKELLTVIRHREEESERLEEELNVYQSDMDRMVEGFKEREQQLMEEIEHTQQKNNVLSNLLDLVTERAESTQRELEKYMSDTQSPTLVLSSPLTSGSLGSDEVFDETDKGKIVVPEREQLMKRIHSLETLLASERQRTAEVLSKNGDKGELQQREKDILKQEFELCQRQLREATERIEELKSKLAYLEESRDNFKGDFEKVSKELEDIREKKAIGNDTTKTKAEKAPASWRWEKQELERQVKEYKKKLEDTYDEMKKHQAKWKMAGEDKEKDIKIREKLEQQIADLKEKTEQQTTELAEYQNKLLETQEGIKKREKQWEKEKEHIEERRKEAEKEVSQKNDTIKTKDDIIEQKDSLVREKDEALTEERQALAKSRSDLKQKEAEFSQLFKLNQVTDKELKDIKNDLVNMESQLREKTAKLKSLDDDLRLRDERLKEKDEILTNLNSKLKEKQCEVTDMDSTIRSVMKKIAEKDNECEKSKARASKLDEELTSTKNDLSSLKKEAEKSQSSLKTELGKVENDRKKLESDLENLGSENKSLATEITELKDKLKKKEDKFKKEKNNLDLELKKATEKLSSLEASRGMRQSDVMKTLSNEKEKLISEKHKLNDELNTKKKELTSATKKWNTERDELQAEIKEKSKLIEDKNAVTEKMQIEIEALKTQIQSIKGTAGTAKGVSIPVEHESSVTTIPIKRQTSVSSGTDILADGTSDELQAVRAKLEQQETLCAAEKAAITEKYELKMKNLEEDISQNKELLSAVRGDFAKQAEALQRSLSAVAEMKDRYEVSLTTWKTDRNTLQASINKLEEYKAKFSEATKEVESIKAKLLTEEAAHQEMKNKLASEKNAWNAEKLSLQKQMKKLEEQNASRAPAKVSDFRSKFEKFEKGVPDKKPIGKGSSSGEGTLERDKVVEDAKKLSKNLQKQLSECEKQREKERNEFIEKCDKMQTEWEKERLMLQTTNDQLSKQCMESSKLERTVISLEQRLEEERILWQEECAQCRSHVEKCNISNTEAKDKIAELLAEVKKLQTLGAKLEVKEKSETSVSLVKTEDATPQSTVSATAGKQKAIKLKFSPSAKDEKEVGKVALAKPSQPSQVFIQVLDHISKLAEEVKGRPLASTSDRQVKPPPLFRRSLSTTEVDVLPEKQTYVSLGRGADEHHLYSLGSPLVYPKPPSSASSSFSSSYAPRSQYLQKRSLSTVENGSGMKTSGGVGSSDTQSSSLTTHRRSYYTSGTQSACVSRDTTPDRSIAPKKVSPYPAAPPSMIITPSQTPQRAQSVERESLSTRDMAKLHEKLSAIEMLSKKDAADRSLVRDKGKGLRLLTHSASVDATNLDATPSPASQDELRSGYSPADTAHTPSSSHSDASLSESLPVSIRAGGSGITPGIERVGRQSRPSARDPQKRAASVSPRTARREFYTTFERRTAGGYTDRRSRPPPESDVSDTDSYYDSHSLNRQRNETLPIDREDSIDSTAESDGKSTFRLSAANFFQNIREKRRLFGSKRAASVDNALQRTPLPAQEGAKLGSFSTLRASLRNLRGQSTERTPKEPPVEKHATSGQSIDISSDTETSVVKTKKQSSRSSSRDDEGRSSRSKEKKSKEKSKEKSKDKSKDRSSSKDKSAKDKIIKEKEKTKEKSKTKKSSKSGKEDGKSKKTKSPSPEKEAIAKQTSEAKDQTAKSMPEKGTSKTSVKETSPSSTASVAKSTASSSRLSSSVSSATKSTPSSVQEPKQGTSTTPGTKQAPSTTHAAKQSTSSHPGAKQVPSSTPGTKQGTSTTQATKQGTSSAPGSKQGPSSGPVSKQGSSTTSRSKAGSSTAPETKQTPSEEKPVSSVARLRAKWASDAEAAGATDAPVILGAVYGAPSNTKPASSKTVRFSSPQADPSETSEQTSSRVSRNVSMKMAADQPVVVPRKAQETPKVPKQSTRDQTNNGNKSFSETPV